jgi:hypothetical protein
MPYLARLFSWIPAEPKSIIRFTSSVGNAVFLFAVYILTLSFGGTPWHALAAALICISTNALFGTWIMFPWLVDSWSLAWALLACYARETPWLAAVFLAFAVASKEYALVLGYVFLVSYNPSLWWTCLPGVFLYLILRLTLKAIPSGNDSPLLVLRQVFTERRRYWFHWKVLLSGLHASPYIIAAFLPYSPYRWIGLTVIFFAWLQLHIAFDRCRLLACSLPFVIPIVAPIVPLWVLSLWVLVTLFWPFHSEWA